ncbi:IclR family transcriptional regulator [Salinibacterium soli]|uniref:IclR family transcriptional regulator n=1 Tax=Antiquaquibacter soli TaxID=3064523 RepID=A0ABT9BI49_9MICO|nr:IclR family transcriptional regulator [Protaetiibacter sp. WY-16]MDO7880680.1 IclR family transcriptional regulator [Protaetiibacter sp. WY-16]
MSATAGDPERLVGSERVLAVLTELAEHPEGISLDELARRVHGSKPTVHRALASLRKAGLAHQTARGVYELGDEFLRLAFRFQDARPETARIEPLLRELAEVFGETAHYAVLDGAHVVYRAKVDPPSGAVRLTSTIGGRNPAYSTAVGKLLLSDFVRTTADLDAVLGSEPLAAFTDHTITDRAALLDEISLSRERGFGLDDQENELGVNCVALAVTSPAGHRGAISVSALAYRRGLDSLVADVPLIRAAVARHLG